MRAILIALSLAAAAQAAIAQPTAAEPDISIRNVRVSAPDVPRTAAFYQKAFGMHEVFRLERPNLLEVILNFGPTVEAAKAAKTTRLIVVNRAPDAKLEGVSNMVFNVRDMDAAVRRVIAAGGSVELAPTRPPGLGDVTVAMIRDPAGNRIELVMRP
ncbi:MULTISPECIES: VOC family protein [unclassified Phenylobacterium]|uniref:VOC family protein n=1 Tax=unclassified Phenylobacterium TaxID=2640670 RepID=UPI00083A4ADB|nr:MULTISPECIES: VOC family protein [unclassified Phenylobacterium]